MSYCRWSSDNFSCDVYVYEDCGGGWTTHVAGNKAIGEIPKVPILIHPLTDDAIQEYLAAEATQSAFLETCERAPIGLPHDGESFNDGSPSECAMRLERLRDMGYNVPQYAIDALREEQQELDNMENKE